MPTLTQDNEELKDNDIVCFAQPMDAYEESALLVIRECRQTRILVSDLEDMEKGKNTSYIIPTRVLQSIDVLKVA